MGNSHPSKILAPPFIHLGDIGGTGRLPSLDWVLHQRYERCQPNRAFFGCIWPRAGTALSKESSQVKDRRKIKDRRANNLKQDNAYLNNRRHRPCRRLNSISAKWVPIETVMRHPILWLKFHEMGCKPKNIIWEVVNPVTDYLYLLIAEKYSEESISSTAMSFTHRVGCERRSNSMSSPR